MADFNKERRFSIDPGKGKKMDGCPYSVYEDGQDVKEYIIPPKGYKFKGWYKGAAPYGFEREKGELVQIETEAAIIREIFETVGSGISLIRVANDLNEREIPTKRGKIWMEGTIRNIIHNPVYVGRIVTEEEFQQASKAVQKNCKGGGRKRQFFTQNINDEKTGQIGALGEMPGAVFMNKCITS